MGVTWDLVPSSNKDPEGPDSPHRRNGIKLQNAIRCCAGLSLGTNADRQIHTADTHKYTFSHTKRKHAKGSIHSVPAVLCHTGNCSQGVQASNPSKTQHLCEGECARGCSHAVPVHSCVPTCICHTVDAFPVYFWDNTSAPLTLANRTLLLLLDHMLAYIITCDTPNRTFPIPCCCQCALPACQYAYEHSPCH